jgi:hypothetical protein
LVDFLNATQSLGQIQRILTQADNEIVIISPYIKISDDLVSRLLNAGNNRNITIKMVCREKDLNAEQRRKLEQTPNLRLYFNERVHAKCFYNDNSMVITSLNLYESSFGDNREMGVLLRNDLENDRSAFKEAKREAEFIISESESDILKPIKASNEKPQVTSNNIESKSKIEINPIQEKYTENAVNIGTSEFLGANDKYAEGHCIRCGDKIPFNPEAPYCHKHYKTWLRYKDPTYPERYCHKCGQEAITSRNNPQCTQCKNIISKVLITR